jgi:ribosomal protein S20
MGLKPSTFERTRAGEWCECACDVRTYISKFERTRAVQWVCEGRCGRTSPRQGWTQRSARSNVQEYVRTPNESIKKKKKKKKKLLQKFYTTVFYITKKKNLQKNKNTKRKKRIFTKIKYLQKHKIKHLQKHKIKYLQKYPQT